MKLECKKISIDDFVKNFSDFCVIDIRSKMAFDSTHLKDSFHISSLQNADGRWQSAENVES